MSWVRACRVVAVAGVAAMLIASPAEAARDCRRVQVQTAACFFSGKPPACHPVSSASQPCFTVRGMLWISSGAPGIRLWPRGTKRFLGVLGGEGDAESPTVLPPRLRAVMTPSAPGPLRTVWGEFRVCPLATERAGWMRPVCIAEAEHVVPVTEPRLPRGRE